MTEAAHGVRLGVAETGSGADAARPDADGVHAGVRHLPVPALRAVAAGGDLDGVPLGGGEPGAEVPAVAGLSALPAALDTDQFNVWLAATGGLIAAMSEAGFDVTAEAEEVGGIARRGGELLAGRVRQ